MEWISVNDRLPDELQTVWVYNIENKNVQLACLIYEDGWLWAISNGTIYEEKGMIVSECETDDDYEFSHWCELPKLPKND